MRSSSEYPHTKLMSVQAQANDQSIGYTRDGKRAISEHLRNTLLGQFTPHTVPLSAPEAWG